MGERSPWPTGAAWARVPDPWFLVESLDEAVAELNAVGIATDPAASNDRERYVHFVAPDGHLYELNERL